MSTPALARPGTATAAIVLLTTTGGSTANTTFQIHAQQVQIGVQNRLNEVTGEAHLTPHFQHGGMTYVSFTFTGFVVSGNNKAIGLEDLSDTTKNNGNIDVTFTMHNGRTIKGTAVFSEIRVQYGRNTPHVQVAMAGVFTGTTKGVTETSTAS